MTFPTVNKVLKIKARLATGEATSRYDQRAILEYIEALEKAANVLGKGKEVS